MSHPPRSRRLIRAGVLLAVSALLLALAAPAGAAAPDGWGRQSGIRHLHFETAPIVVEPGQNSIDNVPVPAEQKPNLDGYLVRMRPDLEFLDGRVPPVDVIHLHHGVWLNASGTSPAAPIGQIQPIFFGGEEKTVFRIPRGYGLPYKKSDIWILNQMIHNNTLNRMKVRLVWDLDLIPARSKLARSVKPVVPLWMDVRRGSGYPVFNVLRGTGPGNGTFTFPDDEVVNPYGSASTPNEFRLPAGGTIVSAIGHLHPGGLRDDIDLVRPGASLPSGQACRRVAVDAVGARSTRRCVKATAGRVAGSTRIFRSQAKYYDPAGPVSWDVSLTASRPDWRVRVRKGDTLRISATYENRQSAWYENMGIVLLFFAQNDTRGIDPFAAPVDWRGVLTHGHLAENNNHGGKPSGLVDPRKVAAGPVTSKVDISGYQYRPGDLGLLGDGGKVPVVPSGSSLTFVNRDKTDIEWHSITACAAPCNRSTGISYPLADGSPATQFDSGQLGFGMAGFEPAENTDTWRAPATLPKGTYTYFCRVHNFMRGAFRVE